MAARKVGLSVISRELQRSSSRLRFCRVRSVLWLCARRSARWARVCLRTSRLSKAKAHPIAATMTRVPKRTSRVLRLIPESPDIQRPSRPATGSLGEGGIFQWNGEVNDRGFPGFDGDLPAHRTRPLVPGGDGVVPGWEIQEPESAAGVGGGEVGIIQDEDDCAHVGVDVTEHSDDPGLIEANRARIPPRVASEIEGGR